MEKIAFLKPDKLEQYTVDYIIGWTIGPNINMLGTIDPIGAIKLEASANKLIKEYGNMPVYRKDKAKFIVTVAGLLTQMYANFMVHRTQRLIKDGLPGLTK